MGLTYHDVRQLCVAGQSGASFENTLMIGRQQLYLHPKEVSNLRKLLGPTAAGKAALSEFQFGEYADPFILDSLRAKCVDILDNSDYEGANIVRDMNAPIPDELAGRYDAVIDGGSIEHIFNVPVCVSNILKLAKVGGRVFITMPANNLCGHGFYQFSPEFAFRIFSPENGFELEKVSFLVGKFPGMELVPVKATYSVADPRTVGTRVGLFSKKPVLLSIQARKVEDLVPFRTTPQQSDYVTAWDGKQGSRSLTRAQLKQLARHLPVSWRNRLRGYYLKWLFSLENKKFYRRLT